VKDGAGTAKGGMKGALLGSAPSTGSCVEGRGATSVGSASRVVTNVVVASLGVALQSRKLPSVENSGPSSSENSAAEHASSNEVAMATTLSRHSVEQPLLKSCAVHAGISLDSTPAHDAVAPGGTTTPSS
jgi:hypothetical protein